MGDMNRQWAPYPHELEAAVQELHYEEGWRFSLETVDRDFEPDDHDRKVPIAGGLTFVILVPCRDSYHPEQFRPVHHYHPVPAATFNRQSWERWLFDRLMDTIRHEAAEWFRFVEPVIYEQPKEDGTSTDILERRPFAPTHGPGDDPYVLHEHATAEQVATSFRGVVKDG